MYMTSIKCRVVRLRFFSQDSAGGVQLHALGLIAIISIVLMAMYRCISQFQLRSSSCLLDLADTD